MSRKPSGVPPHYLRKNEKKRFPVRMVIYDTETVAKPHREKEKKHELKLGQAVYIKEGVEREWLYFENINDFWDFVEGKSHGKAVLYIFAHNEDYDFPVLRGWRELLNRGWILEQHIIEKGIFFVEYSKLNSKGVKRKIQICDTGNIFPMSLKSIGKAMQIEKDERGYKTTDKEIIAEMCKNHVQILVKAVKSLFMLLEEANLSGFRRTLAGLSLSIYKHSFLEEKILIHKNRRKTKLERNAYRGGRSECFQIGEFKGDKYYKLDINSMYPFVMQAYNYPIYPQGESFGMDNQMLVKLLKNYCVIAECNITIDKPAIGIKRKTNETGIWSQQREEEDKVRKEERRLIFPIGTFNATLTTEELKWSLENGKINKIKHVVWYSPAPIFEPFIQKLYSMRLRFDEEGNTAYKGILKLVMNSLYGKFGQKIREMVEVGASEYSDYFERRINYQTGKREEIYHVGGKQFQKADTEEEAEDSLPCISAEVTANARLYLWRFIEEAGLENVYYCDTDSLIVDEQGLERLRGYLNKTELGKFKVEKEDTHLEVWNAKDYKIADEEKLKGIKKNAKLIAPNKYRQEHFFHHKTLLRRPDIDTTGTYITERELKRVYQKGRVSSDGIVKPYMLIEEARSA